ncbi:MAG: Ig-like domain repeat protein, partial [Chloroflexi bacterium]|nr:Ig-like domain repeat protein [Chloroflexota bacterium]
FDIGDFDIGDFDIGDFDIGDFDIGDFDIGDFDIGDFDIGDFDIGDFDIGDFDIGGLNGSSIGSGDIKLGEVGLSNILTQGAKVVGFSANRGTKSETLVTRISTPGMRLFVVVLGANGARNINPYSLQIEASAPFIRTLTGSPLVSPQTPQTTLRLDSAPKTLFVTQWERLQALNPSANFTALLASLTNLAALDAVRGDIISLSSGLYDNWDINPSSIDAVNNVAFSVRAIIQDYLRAHPSIKYIVLVGNDDVVPYRRVPDETVISNERYYLLSSRLKPGTPLYSSVLASQDLTDDYYVDQQPTSAWGRELYLPDIPIGRLVETPQEIGAVADTFVSSGGILRPAKGFASGYTFFADGANQMADNLATKLSTSRLVNESWNADDLRNGILFNSPPPDISAPNAHYTHYAALSAAGFYNPLIAFKQKVLTTLDVVNSTAHSLVGRILFTMGCHAGLNVPDSSSVVADPALGINPALDFPQAMAQRQATWIASTGFGLGETDGLAGTELLLSIFAKELVKGDATVGDALLASKQTYLGSLNPITVYDEKSSIQTTLYGLPMYRVSISGPAPTPQTGSNTLTIKDGASTTSINYALQPTLSTTGTYYTANYNMTAGDAQATAGRPVQPRIVIPLGNNSNPVHSILLTSGTYTDTAGFDPVISRPTNEWERLDSPIAAEPRTLPQSFWPSALATVNNVGQLSEQRLVVIPGQFKPTGNDTAGNIIGTERLYSNITLELLRSTSSDGNPPVISSLDLRAVNDTTVAVTVSASDPSGIVRIIVSTIRNGTFIVTDQAVSGSGPFTLNVPFITGDTLLVQVVDGAGNIGSSSGKGANISVIRVDAGPDLGFEAGNPITLRATVSNFDNLTKPVSYVWDFGDGTYDSGQVNINPFSVVHTYTGTPRQAIATLKVTDAGGGVGVDDVRVTIKTIPLVTLASSPTTNSTIGQPVTFTAMVSADPSLLWPIWIPSPTGGMVTFSDNGVPFATVPVLGTGSGSATAEVTTSALSIGSHIITATYSGDVFFLSGGTGTSTLKVLYGWGGFQSPVPGSQYNIGRVIPVKFILTDFSGNATSNALADVSAQLNSGPVVKYGTATFGSGQYQFNLDTTLIGGARTDDWLTIIVSLDDGTSHSINIHLK